MNYKNYQNVFKRYELKYMLDSSQYEVVKKAVDEHMKLDEYGKSTICNIYFDTPDNLLVRRSIERPIYKEKLRLRSYGIATDNSTVYIELKKKYESVVYKRRISASYEKAMEYLTGKGSLEDSQILREIDYFKTIYKDIRPTWVISYDRYAYFTDEDKNFRVTFDNNILARDYNLTLTEGVEGEPVLDKEYVLMEIKTAGGIPLWMCKVLSDNAIYKTSFSKYGTAYIKKFRRQ